MKNNNQHMGKNPFIILLVITNICLIEHGFTKTESSYRYLWITIPLLIISIFWGKISLRKKTPVRQYKIRDHRQRPYLLYHSEKVRNS